MAEDGPSGFPPDVELYRAAYQNWSKEITIDDLWTCRPTTAAQVASVATWAGQSGWRVRARGAMHAWSPIVITPDTDSASRVVLVDTSGLADLRSVAGGIEAGAGALLVDVLTHLEADGLGLTSVPAVGDITVGGMLAIGAHGAAIPVDGPPVAGNFGCLSNAVASLHAIVYDRAKKRYVEQRFDRHSSELPALVCALGRTIITQVEFEASPLEHLRCRSFVDIPATEMFAASSTGRTLASFFASSGRAEALWYPFTDKPWLKVWDVAPIKPLLSRQTSEPYNYPFSDNIPDPMAELARSLVTGSPQATPLFGQMVYDFTVAGLAATATFDLWGAAKNTQLYIRPTTLRVRELGLAVLTSRRHLQQVTHQLASGWKNLIDAYAARGSYPVNMPFEIRASSLDRNGSAPILTATSPDPSAPEMDVVLFTNVLTLTGTADSDAFMADYESSVRSGFDSRVARVRPEWSKNFAYTAEGPTLDLDALEQVRHSFRSGRTGRTSWDSAAKTLDRLDPYGVFGNDFLDHLFERA